MLGGQCGGVGPTGTGDGDGLEKRGVFCLWSAWRCQRERVEGGRGLIETALVQQVDCRNVADVVVFRARGRRWNTGSRRPDRHALGTRGDPGNGSDCRGIVCFIREQERHPAITKAELHDALVDVDIRRGSVLDAHIERGSADLDFTVWRHDEKSLTADLTSYVHPDGPLVELDSLEIPLAHLRPT